MGLLVSTSSVVHGFRSNGLSWTFRRALMRMYEYSSGALFDWRFGIDTGGEIEFDNLTGSGSHVLRGRGYRGSFANEARRALRALRVPFPEFTFIDLGSGKGRIVALGTTFPFRRVIGLELSEALTEIAEVNLKKTIKRWRSGSCELICGDASTYQLPKEPLVIYMFNSFEKPLTAIIARKIADSVRESPRTVYVIYAKPAWSDVFDRDAFKVIDRYSSVLGIDSSYVVYLVKHRTPGTRRAS